MLPKMICLLSFATACAGSSAALAPASMAVDPMREVTLNADGNYEITPAGVVALKQAEIAVDTRHAIELAQCAGASKVANARADVATRNAEVNAWWSSWAPALIVTGILVGLASGVGLTLGVVHAN